jgi:acetolactate synthase regulatory subunit
MECKVYARLDQGVDSFLRVASTLRRKEFNITALNMVCSSYDSDVDMEVRVDNTRNTVTDVVNVIMKLADVKEVKVL